MSSGRPAAAMLIVGSKLFASFFLSYYDFFFSYTRPSLYKIVVIVLVTQIN